MVRAKKRQHMKTRLLELLSQRHAEPRKFWKALRGCCTNFPPQLVSVHAWTHIIQCLTRPDLPLDCHLPDSAYPQHSQEAALCLHAPISIAEVMEHLRKLQNGKSSGANGLPSELLRYAIKPPTFDEPHPQHKLSAHMCSLLNAFFSCGSIPAALNRVLVTPVHKKGFQVGLHELPSYCCH